MPNILGFIPARGGSKGLKRKNLKLLSNQPLIWYTMTMAKRSKYIDKLVVSTEDPIIAEYVQSQGVDFIPRPPHLASDSALVVDAVIQSIDFLEKNCQYKTDIVINLNPTSPLRTVESIDKILQKMVETNCDSAFGANISFANTTLNYGFWEINDDDEMRPLYDYKNPKNRQEFHNNYSIVENGSIYAIRTEALLKNKSLIGDKPSFIIMPAEESVDINDERDFIRAEIIYKNLMCNKFKLD